MPSLARMSGQNAARGSTRRRSLSLRLDDPVWRGHLVPGSIGLEEIVRHGRTSGTRATPGVDLGPTPVRRARLTVRNHSRGQER